MELPLLLKIFYNASVVAFTGNMIAGLLIKKKADTTHDPSAIVRAFKLIIRNDLRITIPALLVILLLNFSVNGGKLLFDTTLGLAAAILSISIYSTLMFIFIIHPIRSALIKLAGATEFDEKKYNKLSGMWVLFGIMELGPLILILLLSL